jgi:glycosyltransferase involved in cell wall biosynthesis
MRILEIIAGFGAGGAETLLKDLSIELENKGHKVLVIVIDEFIEDVSEISKINQLNKNDIEVISLNRKPGDKSFLLLFKIYGVLKKFRPEVVHIHSFLAAIYFFPFSIFLSNCKFVQTIHSTHIIESKWHKLFYSKLFPLKYKTVFCSNDAYDSLKNIFREGIVIANGIPLYTNKNIRKFIDEKYSIPDDSVVALNIGRVSKEKNQLLLLDLIESLNNLFFNGSLYLLVCGKHYNDSIYQNITLKYNQLKFKNNIKFIGVQDNINNLMYSSDLYISSSIYEGLPITVLEAMNTGIPIVLSPINEHLNIFSDLEACYFPETNTVDSYVALFKNNSKFFIADKEEVIMKRNKMIKKYSISTTTSNYLTFFESLFQNQ